MVALNQASIYHWRNRPDCTNENLSVGYWQASRIHSLLGDTNQAVRHAEVCLSYCEGLKPFYVGYAYEALARATLLTGDHLKSAEYLSLAQAQIKLVDNDKHRAMLAADLSSLSERL